ncbi:amidase family protein [Alkalihalobacterium chitinilyticum]|uniref:Amidase family protein n=1 Tax=Alkalihalobacterium chitinilyticum TaxID=2980103 RepID=A0ABT5VJI1_9BACI|nr:amidase family protein [Alkalihalobacterium chitinilyticum]MDE5415611.1 amidase family protein [Alkalihalobacterium chitinilyticum]
MSDIYKNNDALGMAELVRTKQVQPKELLEEAIQVIEEQNPALNAVIHKMYEQAEAAIENNEWTGRFAGVPMLLKDITQEIEGEPITSGSKAFRSYRAKKDNEFVRRVRNTGAVFLGVTNTPEFALMGITEPAYHGPTRNPWNLNYTPGGSSGGSGAAVAAGMVPMAGANDGGGSIRIPGAYCGLFGLKPTRGRTPAGPIFGRHWQGASSDHVLTKSVRDSAAMLDEVHGLEKGAAFYAPPFDGSYLDCVNQPVAKKLKIAFTTESPLGTEVHPECVEAVLKAVKLLEEMGHFVEEQGAPVDGRKIATGYLTMYFGEVAATLSSLEDVLGRKAKSSDVEPQTWLLGLLGRATTAEEFVLSLREWDKAAFAMEAFHETYDLYITPTTAFPPAKIGELEPKPMEKLLINAIGSIGLGGLLKKTGMVDQIAEQSLMRTPFTQLANLTGQPAMTVPLHMTKDGLPCGVQFIAARGKEDLLYQLAGELEQTDIWIDARQLMKEKS